MTRPRAPLAPGLRAAAAMLRREARLWVDATALLDVARACTRRAREEEWSDRKEERRGK
mgnify:CR=1 FL=1